MLYIGVDPGVSGGIAVVREDGSVLDFTKMPETPRDLFDFLEGYAAREDHISRAVLERVNPGVFGSGKQGRMGVVSAFTFGKGVGYLEMALTAALIPFDLVLPQRWQTAIGCLSKGDKNITKRRAQQLFPSVTVTHAIADALLLAEYCRRFHAGIIGEGRDGKKDSSTRTQAARQTRTRREPAGLLEVLENDPGSREDVRGKVRARASRAEVADAPRNGGGA